VTEVLKELIRPGPGIAIIRKTLSIQKEERKDTQSLSLHVLLPLNVTRPTIHTHPSERIPGTGSLSLSRCAFHSLCIAPECLLMVNLAVNRSLGSISMHEEDRSRTQQAGDQRFNPDYEGEWGTRKSLPVISAASTRNKHKCSLSFSVSFTIDHADQCFN
jgi:hypothetical protein